MVAFACLFPNRKGSCWPLRTCRVVFHLASWPLLGGENQLGLEPKFIATLTATPQPPTLLQMPIFKPTSDFLESWILLAKACLGNCHAYQELLLVSCDSVKECVLWKRNSCVKLDEALIASFYGYMGGYLLPGAQPMSIHFSFMKQVDM